MSHTTPMMQQYQKLKQQNTDALLLFRLGDFYELFFEDAHVVSKILNIALTHRNDIPMCGVPYHSLESYMPRLLQAGKKVAICNQMINEHGDPIYEENFGKAKTKLVQREVVEILTPGTIIEDNYLQSSKRNYLLAIGCYDKNTISFAYSDISSCELEILCCENNISFIINQIARLEVCEILIVEDLLFAYPEIEHYCLQHTIMINQYAAWQFNGEQAYTHLLQLLHIESLHIFGIDNPAVQLHSASVLLEYLAQTKKQFLSSLYRISVHTDDKWVRIDAHTQRNLELLTSNVGNDTYSLRMTLDKTCTAMGARLLRQWIMYPLCNRADIETRLDAVDTLYQDEFALQTIRNVLININDIERIGARISSGKITGKILAHLRVSLEHVSQLHNFANQTSLIWLDIPYEYLTALNISLNILTEGLCEQPANTVQDGHIIASGYNTQLDTLRNVQQDSTELLREYVVREIEKTGISQLKLKNNRLIGYFLEVSNANSKAIPDYFIQRQGLVNAQRFTTNELLELEQTIVHAAANAVELELRLYNQLIMHIKELLGDIIEIARHIAYIDCIQNMAYIARLRKYVRPQFTDDMRFLHIEAGRHPVVEQHISAISGGFIANDVMLDEEHFFGLITGPNMAGKSTYLRQCALISIMAQMGSFVPANSACLCIVDAVYCRVGASDNVARGESTFLVEMSESAHILHTATEHSLIIMDEVGRGTSTSDGLSIAWAICEYLLTQTKARTLFATHYHELIELEHYYDELQNFSLKVKEIDGKIIFLNELEHKASSNSYGIYVAHIAGIPKPIIMRATEILKRLQEQSTVIIDNNTTDKTTKQHHFTEEIGIADFIVEQSSSLNVVEQKIIEDISNLNINEINPLEALQILSNLHARV